MGRESPNRIEKSRPNSDPEGVGKVKEVTGEKIALELVKPYRYRVVYQIILADMPIGEIELDHIAWRSGEAELKIIILDEDLHNRGYGTAAVLSILDQAFTKMNLNRVYLRVHATNAIALRCYEKAGFKKEGRLIRPTEWGQEEIFLMGISKIQFLGKHSAILKAI